MALHNRSTKGSSVVHPATPPNTYTCDPLARTSPTPDSKPFGRRQSVLSSPRQPLLQHIGSKERLKSASVGPGLGLGIYANVLSSTSARQGLSLRLLPAQGSVGSSTASSSQDSHDCPSRRPNRLSLSSSLADRISLISVARSSATRAPILMAHLEMPIAKKTVCTQCGISYAADLDPIHQEDAESANFVQHSLQGQGCDIIGEISDLSGRVHTARVMFNVARLQMRYALGVFLERLNQLEVSEVVLHRALHPYPHLHPLYSAISQRNEVAAYSDVQNLIAPALRKDLSLLPGFPSVDLRGVTKPADFDDLEDQATDYFQNRELSEGNEHIIDGSRSPSPQPRCM